MYKITALFVSALFATISIVSMELDNQFDSSSPLVMLPDPAAIIVVAACENKNALRQTCKRFCEFASRRKNESILLQPQLYLNQEALDRYLLYYGALGNTAIVRNLLARGANPNACEDNGTTLMHHAMRCGYEDIVNILLEHSDLIKHDNMEFNSFSLIQFNQAAIDGICPLCVFKGNKIVFSAIEKGSCAVVQYLLTHGVSANVTNKKGESALYCAAQAGYPNIMKFLISEGAHVNGVSFYDKQGSWKNFRPLYRASEKGLTSAVQLLIDYNADVSSYSDWEINRNVLKHEYVQIFKILAQRVDMTTRLALLHTAVENGRTYMVKILLENGAYEYRDDGNRLLDRAKNDEIKTLLIAYGATEPEQCIVQ